MSHGEPSTEADIPDLSTKKREKEKKRAGFFWSWGGGGEGVSLFSLLGGDGDLAAARAWEQLSQSFSSFFRGAVGLEEGARGAAGASSFGHGVFGKVMLGLAGLVFGLWGWMHWFQHKGGSASRDYDLGGIESSVRPHPGADSERLKFAGESANGQLQWGKPWNEKEAPKQEQAKPEEKKGPEETQKPEDTDWNDVLGKAGEMGGPDAMRAATLNSANLSNSLGGRWGDNNVFSGNYPGQRFQAPKMSGPKRVIASATKALRSFPATARKYAMRGSQRVRSAFSPLAFAQLRLSNALSGHAADMTTAANADTAKSLAADAFDQAATSGGTLPGPASAGAVAMGGAGAGYSNVPTVPPMGPGAPDLTQPPAVNPTNMTPYQNNLGQAMQMIQQAAMLKLLGMLMIAIGVGLIATGWPPTVVAGIALVAFGVYMIFMAMQLADAAKQIGQQIQQAQGQMTQGNVVTQCADQAANLGTTAANCQHDQAPNMNTNIRQDTDKERGASWTWDSESGGGGNSNSNSSSAGKH